MLVTFDLQPLKVLFYFFEYKPTIWLNLQPLKIKAMPADKVN